MTLTKKELEEYEAKDKLFHKLEEQTLLEICSVCEGVLVVRWFKGQYELVCGKNKTHEGTKSKWKCRAYLERDEREKEKIW